MSGAKHGAGFPVAASAEVARLRRENFAYGREIENLRLTANVVAHEVNTRELLTALARISAQILDGERALVGIVEEETIVLQSSYINGSIPRNSNAHFESERGAAPWVIAHHQPYICNDPAHDPQFGADYAHSIQCRNVICLPVLNHQDVVIGIIEVRNRCNGGLFTTDDLRAAETLAMQASIGLERARLSDQMADWGRSLEILLGFNGAINQHLNPGLLVRKVIENAARFLKADGGMAGVVVPLGENGSSILISDAYWSRGKWQDRFRRWSIHEKLQGDAVMHELPHLTNEYSEICLADASLIEEFDVRRVLNVPIKDSANCLLGFFELHKYTCPSAFSWQDATFLESLANTTAVAIQNARLLESLEIKSQQISSLSAFHVTRLEEERRHISRELHDEAGQVLIAIKLALQVLARELPPEMPALRLELDRMRDLVNQSTVQLKDLAKRLRPPTLDQLGLDVAIRQLAVDHQKRTGMAVNLDLHPPAARLPQSVEIALYRVAQEAMINVAKHADASQIWVSLRSSAQGLEFALSDDGKGFDLNLPGTGLGLLGMKERIDMLAGQFNIASGRGKGTAVSVVIPIV